MYWGDGVQITPPHDSGIADAIQENLEPWERYDADKPELALEFTKTISDQYYAAMKSELYRGIHTYLILDIHPSAPIQASPTYV